MSQLKFFKVNVLPTTLEANAFYFVANATVAESYVTDSSGVAKSLGNTALIDSRINTALAGANSFQIVINIAARNALSLNRNTLVLVTDATGDPTVSSGAAMYAWDHANSVWSKVTEYESLDAIINWGNIVGKPTATPGAIDAAVASSHTHTNKPLLDLLSAPSDELHYNGVPVMKWSTNNW
jgi:hypothetical protein